MNVTADNGNTPLHAAVNRGDVAVVRELLSSPEIDVDAANHDCGDVTPLLLAAMHGLRCVVMYCSRIGDYVFTRVCLSVCLSVNRITQKLLIIFL